MKEMHKTKNAYTNESKAATWYRTARTAWFTNATARITTAAYFHKY